MLREPTPPSPGVPRRSTWPFPPYRFVPGLNPRPSTVNTPPEPQPSAPEPRPLGSGSRQKRPQPQWSPAESEARLFPTRWHDCPHYLFGVDLYNFAYWWEAHEAWEDIWRELPPADPCRALLQCFIQVSAAHLKRHLGVQRGVHELLSRAQRNFNAAAAAPPHTGGIDRLAWWTAVQRYFAGQTSRFPFIEPGPVQA